MAQKDIGALRKMAGDKEFADEIFGFHAQQAVEKTIKAWLCSLGVVYPKTHDLSELMEGVRNTGRELPAQFGGLDDLVDFAVQYRYESFDDESDMDREELLHRIIGCFNFVTREMDT